MRIIVRVMVFLAMALLAIASMWTTYVSLNDSILPTPKVDIPLAEGVVWECSIIALALSVAIGMMLFALKIAIIDGQKRLNIVGIIGMTVVAFISIAFNIDVLYRTADRDFFLRYSSERMRSSYENYLAQVQTSLSEKRITLRRELARQEAELDAEVRGLRRAPAGYGPYAREEDYKLTLLQKTTEVELQAVDDALAVKQEADEALRNAAIAELDDIERLQAELRVVCKDLAGISGVALPEVVRMENPLFAVFSKLLDWNQVGFKEIFLLLVAFLMDLGDIIGYTLVPARKVKRLALDSLELTPPPGKGVRPIPGPESPPGPMLLDMPRPWEEEVEAQGEEEASAPRIEAFTDAASQSAAEGPPPPRFRFRRR